VNAVSSTIFVAALTLVSVAAARDVAAAEIDPEAERLLRAMSDALARLESFAVDTATTTEVLLRDGRKLQLVSSGHVEMDRSAGFRMQRNGADGGGSVTFDGSVVTLALTDPAVYTRLPVEGGPDAALDEVRAVLGTEAMGGADLLYADPYYGLLFEVDEGAYVGPAIVNGLPAHHLSFRAKDIDWQIWIASEGPPLPLRYVITSKWVTAAPEFMIDLGRFDTETKLAGFTFQPVEGASEVTPSGFAANLLVLE